MLPEIAVRSISPAINETPQSPSGEPEVACHVGEREEGRIGGRGRPKVFPRPITLGLVSESCSCRILGFFTHSVCPLREREGFSLHHRAGKGS
jgi:hypothetical protein